MKKKVLICSISVIMLIPVIIIVSFLYWDFIDTRSTFKNQEQAAINFVEENYEESFELIDARDVNFNAGFSEFYFYNQEADFYFSVYVSRPKKTSQGLQPIGEVYGSDYEGQKKGSFISKDIKERFSDLEFIISTFVYSSELDKVSTGEANKAGDETYIEEMFEKDEWTEEEKEEILKHIIENSPGLDNTNKIEAMEPEGFTHIKMLNQDGLNDKKIYEFLKYIVDEYKMNVDFFLLNTKKYKSFKKKPLNSIITNAGFDYESHIEIIFGDEVYHWIKDASLFDYEMYLKLKKFDEYLNDDTGSVVNPFE